MSQYTFKFIVSGNGLAEDSFTLLNFSGEEAISSLFDFELNLRCEDLALDEDKVLNQPCRLEIYFDSVGVTSEPIRVIRGMVNELEDIEYYPDHTLYRAKMVPRVWQLGLFETNEVYLNQSIAETITTIMEEAGFVNGQDFRFTLNRNYRKWPFRLQYKETHLSYLQRIIEREGIYYYFEDTDDGEVIVFCDNNQALPSIPARGSVVGDLDYQTTGALNAVSQANTITSIICKRHSLPKKVILRDFNDETPSLDIRGEYLIDNKGMGEINLYGLNIVSPEEGEELAEIHANAFICRHKSYIGETDVINMSAGHTFSICQHPRDNFNQLSYLLESIHHEGANLVEGATTQSGEPLVNYSNSFSSFSAELEFAPHRQTSVPEIKGTLNAVIDAEADSDYAELDETGRYKVRLPFDRKDRDGGKASHWVRMMQPYGGTSEGMHFPLRKGARVLLGFIGGDPDRPFISGAINDSGDQQSVVTGENQTNSVIKTSSGNKIELEDQEGKNRIKFHTGDDKTYLHLGAPNHSGDGWVMTTEGIEKTSVYGGQKLTIQTNLYVDNTDEDYRNNFDFPFTSQSDIGVSATELTNDEEISGQFIIHRTKGEHYTTHLGIVHQYYESLTNFVDSTSNDASGLSPNSARYSYGPLFEAHRMDYEGDFSTAFDLLFKTSTSRKSSADSDSIPSQSLLKSSADDLIAIAQSDLSDKRTTISDLNKVDVVIGSSIRIEQEGEDNNLVYNYNSDGKLIYVSTGDYEASWSEDGSQMVFETNGDETRTWNDKGKITLLEKDDGDYTETWDYDSDDTTEKEHTLVEGDRTQQWVSSIGGSPASYTDFVESGNSTSTFEAKYDAATTQTASFSFGASHESTFTMSAGVSSSESIEISASAENVMSTTFSLGLSNTMTFELSAAAKMMLSMEISGGPSISIENKIGLGGPSIEIEIEDGTMKNCEVSGFGTNARLSAMVAKFEAEQALEIKSKQLEVLKNTLVVKATELRASSSKANLANAIITLIS